MSMSMSITMSMSMSMSMQLDTVEEGTTETDIDAVNREFQRTLNKAYLTAFRLMDNKNQEIKGQPSLDKEDTGVQYKNDPLSP